MSEAERIARIMHFALIEFSKTNPHPSGQPVAPTFDGMKDWTRASYIATAQAILDELCPSPIIVEEHRG